jgi:TPR repeat protein
MLFKRQFADVSQSLRDVQIWRFFQKASKECFTLAMKSDSKRYFYTLWIVGDSYRDGIGAEQNYSEAFKYYTKAIECCSPDMIKEIDKIYKEWKGVTQDEAMSQFYN